MCPVKAGHFCKEKAMDENTPVQELITIDDFMKVKLAVGEVISAEKHPNADRLLVAQVKIGEETRQLVAGMSKWYTPEEMVGLKIVVVTNLKPVKLRGVESQGMMLAASSADDVTLLSTHRDIPSGSTIK